MLEKENFLTACRLNLSESLVDVRMDKERQLHICVGFVGWGGGTLFNNVVGKPATICQYC